MKKAIAAGVMAAAALVFAVPAQAAPEGNFLGYETPDNGMPPQPFMWSVTGCGDGCVTVHVLPNGWTQNFTFDGANWVGHLEGGTVGCMGAAAGQRSGPASLDFVVNPAFSGGSSTISFQGGFTCGEPQTATHQLTLAPA
jgi:hypothetical protein